MAARIALPPGSRADRLGEQADPQLLDHPPDRPHLALTAPAGRRPAIDVLYSRRRGGRRHPFASRRRGPRAPCPAGAPWHAGTWPDRAACACPSRRRTRRKSARRTAPACRRRPGHRGRPWRGQAPPRPRAPRPGRGPRGLTTSAVRARSDGPGGLGEPLERLRRPRQGRLLGDDLHPPRHAAQSSTSSPAFATGARSSPAWRRPAAGGDAARPRRHRRAAAAALFPIRIASAASARVSNSAMSTEPPASRSAG